MRTIQAFFFNESQPFLSAWRQQRFHALFWDFGSLHKRPRNERQEEQFKRALAVMASAYASPRTVVLQHKALPLDFPADQPTYERSGWCTMEQAAASIEGQTSKLFELCRGWIRHAETRSP